MSPYREQSLPPCIRSHQAEVQHSFYKGSSQCCAAGTHSKMPSCAEKKTTPKNCFHLQAAGTTEIRGWWYNGTEEECRRSWVDDMDVDDAIVDVNVDDANPL